MSSFPNCVVCSSPFRYKGRQPHLLPCLHAVCSVCLDQEIDGDITCSVCQRSHARSNQSFPVDHVVLAEVLHLTAQHRPSEISCTNKEDGNQAVCWCEECSDFLCEHCQISHTEIKVTKVHKIWEMSDLSQTFKKSHSKCTSHGLPENVFDKDCDQFMCSHCFVMDHTNHVAISSEESTSVCENNLKQYVKSVSEKRDTVLQSKATVDTHTEISKDSSSHLRETVQHTFSELRSLLDQREKVILLELDQLMECMNTTNNSRRPVLKGIETSCQATLDYMNKCLLYTPPQHFHQLKSSIGEATQFCNNAEVPQVNKQETSVDFSKHGLQDLRSAISSFGSFLAPHGETGQPDDFTSFQSVKINSLERTIESLQTQMTECYMMKLKTLTEEVSKRGDQIQELEETNRHLQKVVQQVDPDGLTKDSFLHLIKNGDNQVLVMKYTKMTLDYNRANLERVNLDGTGALVNCEYRKIDNAERLQNFCGTSATSPLPSSGLVYWEVNADVDIVHKLPDGGLVLEIAVCREDMMDLSSYVGHQLISCSFILANSKADRSIGVFILENGKQVDSQVLFMDNQAGTIKQLKFGVLFNGGRNEVTFIDVTDMQVLGRGTVAGKTKPAKLWPMFAPFASTRKMRLVSGVDIKMSPEKNRLLCEALRG